MDFFDYWQQQKAQERDMFEQKMEQAQGWIGHRVWVRSAFVPGSWVYGEVERINERGRACIVVGYNDQGRPYYHEVDVRLLGETVLRAG